jgi:hypothetical protein
MGVEHRVDIVWANLKRLNRLTPSKKGSQERQRDGRFANAAALACNENCH